MFLSSLFNHAYIYVRVSLQATLIRDLPQKNCGYLLGYPQGKVGDRFLGFEQNAPVKWGKGEARDTRPIIHWLCTLDSFIGAA
jgi:hypothetical protein